MLNSLTVFLAFLGFLVFGYLSLVRVLYRQQFDAPVKTLFLGIKDSQGLLHIGSSAFFVSLPATSLLLFWGWGPALIWLVVFHLLADSLVNLQVTAVDHQAALSEYLVASDHSLTSKLMRFLIQAYLVLLLSVILTLLAKLIDKESGLLFALIGLIPAYRVLRNSNTAVPRLIKQAGALLLLFAGFAFANELGFAIYGDWRLLGESIPWLRLNNTTILAALLLTGGYSLANNQAFSDDVAKLAGAIVIAIIAILAIKLLWLRPPLDAPLNSTQLSTGELPLFVSFCMFLFAGLTTLFFRVFNSTAPSAAELPPAADFGRVQAESILQLLLASLLVLCLASAIGIGAWKSHYLDWNGQTDFTVHLNLAISSLLTLLHSGTKAGNLMHISMMAGFCIAGLSFLRVCIKALSLVEMAKVQRVGEVTPLLQVLIQSKLLQAIAAFVLSSYFIAYGISIDSWLLLGMLSWLIVVQLIIAMTVSMQKATFARLVYGSQCLILVGVGSIQTLWASLYWLNNQHYAFAACGFSVLLIGCYLWLSPLREIVRRFIKTEDKSLFD